MIELPLFQWVTLLPDFRALCGSAGWMDSFLAIRSEGECILNLNDCVGTPAQECFLQRLIPEVSVLFMQFSFANWIGNRADQTNAVNSKLSELEFRVRLFKPEFTVPFASFIYFCNQENSWMNDLGGHAAARGSDGLAGRSFYVPGRRVGFRFARIPLARGNRDLHEGLAESDNRSHASAGTGGTSMRGNREDV